MIKPTALLLVIILIESQAPAGATYWPRYLLEFGLLVGALSGVGGIMGDDGRPITNYCKKCGRAYPGAFHRCK